jgi:predicted Zn-dependent protease
VITRGDLVKGRTLAEVQGMTAEVGRAIAGVAAAELARGRLDSARRILEGLATANPRDPVAWVLLSAVLRRQGERAAARVCADAAVRLAPRDPQARLARAESLLSIEAERADGRRELLSLRDEPEPVGGRARALLRALGP